MKTFKKIAFLFLCMFLFQAVALPSVIAPVQVEAATKSGLKKESGKYYYYVKGKRIKKAWKKVNGKKYYFSKTGAAYKAPADAYSKYHVVLKKIGTKYYGFDKNAVMVKGGVRTSLNGTAYVFNSTGVYDKSKTTALRNALKAGNLETVKTILGPCPNIFKDENSCLAHSVMDIAYNYNYVTLTTYIDEDTLEEKIAPSFPLLSR